MIKIRRHAHVLTMLALFSSVVYLSLYNRSLLLDLFDSVPAADVDLRREMKERRGYAANIGEVTWGFYHNRSQQDTPETSLRRLAPQVFENYPKPFSSKFKNPCWEVTGRRRPHQCLPYFYLIGMPKCGTTDVWNKLLGHPQVVDTSKEPHWWSRVRIAKLHRATTKLTEDPISYYKRYAIALNNYAARHKMNRSKLVVGDGSASTMWDNQHWKLFYPQMKRGPPHVNGELIVTIQPDARAIAILRNPTDRLYSDYLFFTNQSSLSPQHFHDRVIASLDRFKQCVSELDIRTCTYSTSSISRFVRIEVGLYIVYISDWLSFFPRRRLKVVTMEDWHQNCLKTLLELHNFLELERQNTSAVYETCTNDVQNIRSPHNKVLGPMLPETKQILDDFYAPFNKELARMLGSEKFLWIHTDSEEDE